MDTSESGADRLVDALLHPLSHFLCPNCGIRFGLELDDIRWMEQTGAAVHCPRGHELHFGWPEEGTP